MKKVLYFFVEGYRDFKFFSDIIIPKLNPQNIDIQIFQYANLKGKWDKIESYIKAFEINGYEYYFIVDKNDAICITERKNKIMTKIKNIQKDKIIVVEKEIESWLLAGLNSKSSEKLNVKNLSNTENITKEKFEKMFEGRIISEIIPIIINHFDIQTAKYKNKSFKYFCSKLGI